MNIDQPSASSAATSGISPGAGAAVLKNAAAQASQAAAAAAPVAKPQPKAPEKVDLGYDPTAERANLQEAVERLNDQMKSKNRDLSFAVDERVNRTIITVKKLSTGELVRQIPTEEVIKMAHSIEDMKGLLFNQVL